MDFCPLLMQRAVHNPLNKHVELCLRSSLSSMYSFQNSMTDCYLFYQPEYILGATWSFSLSYTFAALMFNPSFPPSVCLGWGCEGCSLLWWTSLFCASASFLWLYSGVGFTCCGNKWLPGRAGWRELVSWPEVNEEMSSVPLSPWPSYKWSLSLAGKMKGKGQSVDQREWWVLQRRPCCCYACRGLQPEHPPAPQHLPAPAPVPLAGARGWETPGASSLYIGNKANFSPLPNSCSSLVLCLLFCHTW